MGKIGLGECVRWHRAGLYGWNSIVSLFFAVPFLDETIQLFTEGRSGQISDVWLDMAGALTGTLLYLAAGQIYLRIKKNENG